MAGGSTWNAESDKDLLLTIIARGNLTSISWPDIAATMTTMNYTFTHEACRQHFQKIRRERQKALGISPTKPTASTNSKTTTTPRKRASPSKSTVNHANFDDEECFQDTPSKKAKKSNPNLKKENGAISAPSFKMEEGVEVGDEENGVYFQRRVVDLENDDLYDEDVYGA